MMIIRKMTVKMAIVRVRGRVIHFFLRSSLISMSNSLPSKKPT